MEIRVTPSINFNIKTDGNKLIRAVNSALRRTLRGVRKDIGGKVKERYTIAPGNVTKTVTVKAGNLRGEITSRGRVNPLERFKINPRRRLKRPPASGVFAENIRGQGGYLKHAFIKGGGVFERTGRKRFPIKKIQGPSAPGILKSPPMSNFIMKKIEERIGKNLQHEINAIQFF